MSKNTPKTARAQKCILDDESLDLITESDHKNHQCICSLCSCGNHTCPARRLKLYPKATFTSQYKQDFKSPGPSSPPKRVTSAFKPTLYKMTEKTTNEIDYKPYDLSQTSKTPIKNDFSASLRFLGRSQYQADFPNWGPTQSPSDVSPKKPKIIKRKFDGTTIYNQSYICKSLTPDHKRKVQQSTSIPSMYKYDGQYESTTKREFKSKSNKYITPSPTHKNISITPTHFNPNQYISVAKQSFTGLALQLKDPRLIRKQKLNE
ncbi:unnamed protein product [Blepharisma stoltei]|uniref:STOP protein n=1 Tax=Blepharisma stoltei TaxID=1481888 RepID=A0AAU9JBY6_9CILI|nr:unnamed protein product [Blepharisma stoltei]